MFYRLNFLQPVAGMGWSRIRERVQVGRGMLGPSDRRSKPLTRRGPAVHSDAALAAACLPVPGFAVAAVPVEWARSWVGAVRGWALVLALRMGSSIGPPQR